MWTVTFWKDAAERAIKTAAQSAIGALTATAALNEVNWEVVGWTVAGATILSVLTSVASSRVGSSTSASAVE